MTFSFPSSYLFTSNAVIDGCSLEKLRNRRCLYLRVLTDVSAMLPSSGYKVNLRSCAPSPYNPFMSLFLSPRPLFEKTPDRRSGTSPTTRLNTVEKFVKPSYLDCILAHVPHEIHVARAGYRRSRF